MYSTYVHGVSCFHLAMYCYRRRNWGSCYRNPATIRYKQVQMKVSTHCVHVTTMDLRMGEGGGLLDGFISQSLPVCL